MPCYHPLSAWRTSSGEVVFVERGDIVASLFLPCGRCVGCRLERSRQWAVRMMHEAQMYDRSSFVTMTYDQAHLPPHGSLHYPHWQTFMKAWRKRYGPTRFFCAGEYGGLLGRPHFHAALFGVWPSDCKPWRKSESGHQLFRSEVMEQVWGRGSVEIGELTFESAAYMARYCLEKITGDLAEDHYRRVDPETGEVVRLVPEFARMSLRPGIGARWYSRFGGRVLDHDNVITNGHPAKPPRYYDVLSERKDPHRFDEIREERASRARVNAAEGTDDRLRVREAVAQARVNLKKRNLR